MLRTDGIADYISNDGKQKLKRWQGFWRHSAVLSDNKTTSQERTKKSYSKSVLFLEPEGFYAYGFFFFLAQMGTYM